MKRLPLLLLITFITLALQGCYWYETLTLRIDLGSKTGVVEMGDISSLPDNKNKHWTKTDIRNDWESFLKDYNEGTLIDNQKITITDKQLNENNKALNSVIKFSYNDIADIDIRKSGDNTKLLMKKGPNDKVVETNGTTMMIDSVEYLSWDINAKDIYVKYRMIEEKDKHHSLLKHYQKWKKNGGK